MNQEPTPVGEPITSQPTQSPKQDWKHHFTTVTPLSKALAMLLFIVLPFIGFWFGFLYGTPSSQSTESPQPLSTSVFEPSETAVSDTDMEIKNDTVKTIARDDGWHSYSNATGFRVMVPNSYSVEEKEGYVRISSNEDPLVGYEIHYAKIESADVQQYARKLWGSDCEVEPKYVTESLYEDQWYDVTDPETALDPEERGQLDCKAFKVSFVYNPHLKLALSWAMGQEFIMPTSADSWKQYEEGASADSTYYDSRMLDSIKFSY